jgi:hypothetical protein
MRTEELLSFSVEPRRNEDGTDKPDGLYVNVYQYWYIPRDKPQKPPEVLQKALNFFRRIWPTEQNPSKLDISTALGETNVQTVELLLVVLREHQFELTDELHSRGEQYGYHFQFVFRD